MEVFHDYHSPFNLANLTFASCFSGRSSSVYIENLFIEFRLLKNPVILFLHVWDAESLHERTIIINPISMITTILSRNIEQILTVQWNPGWGIVVSSSKCNLAVPEAFKWGAEIQCLSRPSIPGKKDQWMILNWLLQDIRKHEQPCSIHIAAIRLDWIQPLW